MDCTSKIFWATIQNGKIVLSTDGKSHPRLLSEADKKTLDRTLFRLTEDMIVTILQAGKIKAVRKVIDKSDGFTLWVRTVDAIPGLFDVELFTDKKCTVYWGMYCKSNETKFIDARRLDRFETGENCLFDVEEYQTQHRKIRNNLEIDHIPSSAATQIMDHISKHQRTRHNPNEKSQYISRYGISIAIPKAWHSKYSCTHSTRQRSQDIIQYSKSLPKKKTEALVNALKVLVQLRNSKIQFLKENVVKRNILQNSDFKTLIDEYKINEERYMTEGEDNNLYFDYDKWNVESKIIKKDIKDKRKKDKELREDKRYLNGVNQEDENLHSGTMRAIKARLLKYHQQKDVSDEKINDPEERNSFIKIMVQNIDKKLNRLDFSKWEDYLLKVENLRVKTDIDEKTAREIFDEEGEIDDDDLIDLKENWRERNELIQEKIVSLEAEVRNYKLQIEKFPTDSKTDQRPDQEQEPIKRGGRMIIDSIFPAAAICRDIKTMINSLLENPTKQDDFAKLIKSRTLKTLEELGVHSAKKSEKVDWILNLYGSYRYLYARNIANQTFRTTEKALIYKDEQNPLRHALTYTVSDDLSAAKQLDEFFNACFKNLSERLKIK